MKADTGEKAHYFTQSDAYAWVDVQPKNLGHRVSLPENSTMDSEQLGHLPLALPPSATETHVFSALQNASLISVGQLCDDGCQAILTKIPSSIE